MSLYRCTQCGCAEDAALGKYWEQHLAADGRREEFKPKCSLCHTGEWHGKFPREVVTGEWLQDTRGYIWRPDDAERVPHLGPFTNVVIDEPTQPSQSEGG